MKSRIVCAIVALAVAVPLFATGVAEARGRGKPSPFVMTPSGPIPKSVFYAGVVDDATLMRYQQAEQAYMNAKNKGKAGTTGTKPTATKPTTAKKK
jgi:hypothetical protein